MQSSRRQFLKIVATVPIWGGAALTAQAARDLPTKRFVVLHSNDPHGHLLPFSWQNKTAPGDFVSYMPERKEVGGLARRATLIKEIKKKEKHVYAFDAGDAMDGSPFSSEYFGKADYEAMSLCGFDYGTFGNHDFNMSAAQFAEMRACIKYPMILANVYKKGTEEPIEKPFVFADWDGLKVAILAVTTYSSRSYKAITEAFEMKEPQKTAEKWVPKLRENADLVILLSHCGYDEDKKMAREVPGIDLIIGAHSHTRLPVGDFEYTTKPGRLDPQGTVIVQAHCYGGELGRLDLRVQQLPDKTWRITRYSAELLPVDENVKEDKAVKEVITRHWEPIKAKYGEVVGEAADEFVELRGADATNYYLMCDAIFDGVKDEGAEFEIENFGGVRAPVLQGPITRAELIEVDPFTNTIVTFQIKGSDLKKLLAETKPAPSKSLHYVAKRSEPPKDGESEAEKRKKWTLVSAMLNGQPIEDEKVYKGAASSYYFGASIKPYAIDPKDSGKQRSEYLVAYIKKNTPIQPTPDGRLKLEGGTSSD